MIYKSASPLSPNITLLFNGVEVNYNSLYGADLHVEENHHDLLVVKMAGIPARLLLDYLGVPVYFVINSGSNRIQEFTGYVSNIEPTNIATAGVVNRSAFQDVHIYCIGASYVMKGARSAHWSPPSLRTVVNTLSKRYDFSAEFPADAMTLSDLSQIGESDWAFLIKVAERYGYRVLVNGTHIHVWDPFKATGRVSSYHELISANSAVGAQPCTILSFEGTFGLMTESGGIPASTVAFLDNQGNTLQVSSKDVRAKSYLGDSWDSSFESFRTSNSLSFQEAQREVLRNRKNNMPFEATVTVTAGAGIKPGGVVNVLNYGSDFDGLWYVRSVQHEVGQNHYSTHLKILKDGMYNETLRVASVSSPKRPPDPRVISTKWVTTSRRVIEYV
jgi:hypothetical protein